MEGAFERLNNLCIVCGPSSIFFTTCYDTIPDHTVVPGQWDVLVSFWSTGRDMTRVSRRIILLR